VGVVELRDATDVEAHVVARPVLAELVAAGRQLADEVGEVAVVEVAGARVEEDEARGVRALLAVEHLREQGAAERVGAEDVEPVVVDVRGRAGQRVQQLLHGRADAVLDQPATEPSCRRPPVGESFEPRVLRRTPGQGLAQPRPS
jgi:hypothetical protein